MRYSTCSTHEETDASLETVVVRVCADRHRFEHVASAVARRTGHRHGRFLLPRDGSEGPRGVVRAAPWRYSHSRELQRGAVAAGGRDDGVRAIQGRHEVLRATDAAVDDQFPR